MIRTRLGSWHTLFLAAVGVAPFGCGGATSVEISQASGGVGVAGGSGGTDPGRTAWSCTNPTMLTGMDTGYVQCAEGYKHRTKQVACSSIYPRPGSQIPADPSGGSDGAGATGTGGSSSGSLAAGGTGGAHFPCSEDTDCKERASGYCQFFGAREASPFWPGVPAHTMCSYGCVTDQDCGAGAICECGTDIGRCVRSTCRTDADCVEGSLCAGGDYGEHNLCGREGPIRSYSCQLRDDQCFANAQCGAKYCEKGQTNRTCAPRCGVVSGRPFCVDNLHRQASPVASESWLGSPIFVSAVDQLDPAFRRELAAHYTEIALMEHASVAAFARFSLHLMSMGAPAWLLSETQRAMGDEIEHATACFALASSYAGSHVGPSRLQLEGAFEHASVLEIIVTAVKEACFGETIAAIEAAEAASGATVPAVRELLLRISADETRHAELGWRFLAWALQNVGASKRGALTTALRELLRTECADANQQLRSEGALNSHAAVLGAHGILSPASRGELRRGVLRDVVTPVLNSLLAALSGSELMTPEEIAAIRIAFNEGPPFA